MCAALSASSKIAGSFIATALPRFCQHIGGGGGLLNLLLLREKLTGGFGWGGYVTDVIDGWLSAILLDRGGKAVALRSGRMWKADVAGGKNCSLYFCVYSRLSCPVYIAPTRFRLT